MIFSNHFIKILNHRFLQPWKIDFQAFSPRNFHCVKRVQIQSFYWSRIWTEYEKIRTRKNSVFGYLLHSASYNDRNFLKRLNPFLRNAPFLYSLKISENSKVFCCFQVVEKWCIGNECVKEVKTTVLTDIVTYLFIFDSRIFSFQNLFFDSHTG